MYPTRRFTGPLWVIGLLLCGGCAAGDQIGTERPAACGPVSKTSLTLNEASVLGFSGQQVLDLVAGEHRAKLTWADGKQTDLTIGIAYDGGRIEYLDNERNSDGADQQQNRIGGLECLDTVEIEVLLAVTTTDGALAEKFGATLIAEHVDRAMFTKTLAQVEGDFDAWSFVQDAETYEAVRAWVTARFEADKRPVGSIDGQAFKAQDTATSGTAVSLDEIATFEGVEPPG